MIKVEAGFSSQVARAATEKNSRLFPEAALRANWLNAFRLLLAILVLFSHCYPVIHGSDDGEPLQRWTGGQLTFGAVAVNAFFLISGFLIVASWLRTKSMADYFRHRILRIHPGFVVALAVSFLLALLSCPNRGAYLHAVHWRDVFVGSVTLAFGTLDNAQQVFAHNPLAGVVNASLWTIPLEFYAYIAVALYGLFGLFRFRGLWLTFAALVFVVYEAKILRDGQADAWWRFGCFFTAGATFYLLRDVLPRSRVWVGGALLAIAIGFRHTPWLNAVLPFAGGWILFHAAALPVPAPVARLLRTDLSYGVYLYAFPIQQLTEHYFSIREPFVLFLVALPATVLCAWLSWTFVESPCLALKSRSFPDWDAAAPDRCGREHGPSLK